MPEGKGLFAVGVSDIEVGDINAATGLGENWASVGKVYKGSATMTQADSETAVHYSEFDNFPVEMRETVQGLREVKFTIMDVASDQMVKWCGGSVTDVAGQPDKWSAPAETPNLYKAIRITSSDGTVFEYRRMLAIGKLSGTPQRDGYYGIDAMCTALAPLINGVAPIEITDREVTTPV